jgi:hypothetical protein
VGDQRPDSNLGVFYRPDTVSVFAVPPTTAQAVVRRIAAAGGTLAIDAEPNCGAADRDRLCGFQAGIRVLVFDRWGHSATGTVTAVDGWTVHLESLDFRGDIDVRAGAALTEIAVHVYALGVDPDTRAPRLMHYDGRRTELPVVDHVVGLRLEYFGDPSPPVVLPGADLEHPDGPWTTYGAAPPALGVDVDGDLWGAGENCLFAAGEAAHASRLPRLADGDGLIRLDAVMLADGPWCPDAAHPDRFDADLLRIRRVRIVIRVEAAPDGLRGPAGPLFARRGTAASARQLIPDQELRFDVAPRNLNLDR